MRILVAHSFYRLPGGEDGYVRRQLELLRPYHEIALFQRSNEALRGDLGTAIRMVWSARLTSEVEAFIDGYPPDVVHLHNAYPGLGPAVHLAAGHRGVPLVMTVHNARLRCPNGLMFTQGSVCRRCEHGRYGRAVLHGCFPTRGQAAAYAAGLWVHRFPLRLERRVTTFIAPSAYMAGQLRRWGLPADRIAMVPNFTALRPDASAEPGAYGLYLGRLTPEKGLEVLLTALAAAGDPPFRIVGRGPLEDALRREADRLALRNTEFLGHLRRPAVDAVLTGARFVALPSAWPENAPLAALEAMAAGRPLVVSAMGGLPELVEGGAGVTCPPGNAAALADRMTELFRDDRRCREAGARALDRATASFGPDLHRRRLEDVYASAAGAVAGASG